ncbi:cytidylyltransferase domain-containing protein [Oleidesulfovibrio sp.]|uniref:cytidylyltransferase domain-containing protein n=1 Tax=Oleidesulfovibrio sp. TaxID=2909707 RepID=UPI003A8B8CF1
MRCVAVVEARMGSTRFPGKVLSLLAGMPVLQHIGIRLGSCKALDKIILATSTHPRDDVLAKVAPSFGFDVIRGPEDNLFARHLLVLDAYSPDIIVRVTGDCPLVDPDVITRLIDLLQKTGADYATVRTGTPCIHEGIDPFRTSLLRRLALSHKDNPVVKEHVVSGLKGKADIGTVAYLELPEREQLAGVRISIDTPADLAFLEEIHRLLHAAPAQADIRDVADLLRANPELLSINSHVKQKKAGTPTVRIVARCLDSAHVPLLAAVLGRLRDTFGFGIRIASESAHPTEPALEPFAHIADPLEFMPDLLLDAGTIATDQISEKKQYNIPSARISLQDGTIRLTYSNSGNAAAPTAAFTDAGIEQLAKALSEHIFSHKHSNQTKN